MSGILLLDEADLYKACFYFVRKYALPALPENAIYRGWANRAALPAMSEEYAVISLLNQYRRGTTVESFSAPSDEEDGTTALRELVEGDVQIDLCSAGEDARRRAQCLETVARSSEGVRFFKEYGIGCEYAADIRDLSFIGDSQQQVRRFMTTLRLNFWTGLAVPQDWFKNADVNIKNVDVRFPPLKLLKE